jgi:hypothetical protein
MPRNKPDLVRRSLFGSGGAPPASEEPDKAPDAIPQGRPAQRTARPRRAVVPQAPPPVPEVAPTSSSHRRPVERTAVTVPSDLLLQVKDAVAVLNGWPHQYTMARFVEEAFSAQLDRMKAEHNGGRDFPETNRKIRTGRPPGS